MIIAAVIEFSLVDERPKVGLKLLDEIDTAALIAMSVVPRYSYRTTGDGLSNLNYLYAVADE